MNKLDMLGINHELRDLVYSTATKAEVPSTDVKLIFTMEGWNCSIEIRNKRRIYATLADSGRYSMEPRKAAEDALESVRIYREMWAEDEVKRKNKAKKTRSLKL